MPYTKQEDREKFANALSEMVLAFETKPPTAGDLNFIFTTLGSFYIKKHGLSYQTCNDIMGALEGAKLEWYRRIVGPYEDMKIEQNGDIF